jgi:hypothetical protein
MDGRVAASDPIRKVNKPLGEISEGPSYGSVDEARQFLKSHTNVAELFLAIGLDRKQRSNIRFGTFFKWGVAYFDQQVSGLARSS